MARGRMISNSLSTSEKFAAVGADPLGEFCQAMYPLIVSHSDDFGRLQGDAFTVKVKCYPASNRSLEEFNSALAALHRVGLIVWYEVAGKRYIQIVDFDRHQQGLHKRTRSQFPRVPGISGKDRHDFEVSGTVGIGDEASRVREEKRREGKRREGKRSTPLPPTGGRITRADRELAEQVLKGRFGRCLHDPPCGSSAACADTTAREIHDKRTGTA